MKGIASALVISVILIVAIWLVGETLGFQVSLLGSIGLTVALTIILNLVLAAFSSRRGRRW
jgi:hypothetical protein